MKIKTTGRKVTLKQGFLERAEKRMSKFDKYFERDAEASVTVTVEGSRQTVEITVRNRGFIYRAERTGPDMDIAFGEAAEAIDRQILKNKSKLGARIKKHEPAVEIPFDDSGTVDDEYRVVREKRFVLKPMSVDEAILQMNMLGHNFFMFQNTETDSVNVVYRRHNDDYGLLLPD